jgi:adenylyl-sulfate kinase
MEAGGFRVSNARFPGRLPVSFAAVEREPREVQEPVPELPGCCLWFTGLSGAGKSTIANIVVAELRGRGRKVELLDGDEIREHLSKGLGFSKADRDENIRRIGWVASVLARNGVVSVTAAISPYRAVRDQVRGWIEHFVEIHVATPLEECETRDVKGLYAKARAGEIPEFTGVSDPYEAPLSPEVVVHTSGHTPEESAAQVVDWLAAHGLT